MQIEIPTEDGIAPAWLFHPAEAPRAGVLLYMDAFGPRPALEAMARRLADAGYLVLLPDLLYRAGDYGPVRADSADEAKRAQIFGLVRATTLAMTRRDSGAFLDRLSAEGAAGAVGVVGYCMGGARALLAAADHPGRVAAAASFHGGNLASEAPDSPHRLAAAIKARLYVGVAGVDGSFPPEQSARLALALREAEVDHAIETYAGMGHGWTVPDHRAHAAAGAERHWKRLLTFFDETLA
jgi:carboxymethylenebutenolidase